MPTANPITDEKFNKKAAGSAPRTVMRGLRKKIGGMNTEPILI